MKPTLFLCALLLCCNVCNADPVLDRPETSRKWWLTAVYQNLDSPTVRDRELYSVLRRDPRLANLVRQVTFTEWDSDSQFVNRSEWKSYLGTNRPALLLQTPATSDGTGTVVYFASGPHLKTNGYLADSVGAAISQYQQRTGATDCPRCPRRPQPAPVAPPVQPQIPQIVPNVDVDVRVPDPEPAKEETPVLFLILSSLAGGGFALFQSLKKENSV